PDDTETDQVDSMDEQDLETAESEAAAYLDALIQATVFQDADTFIDRAPESYTEEKKESEAETQRDLYKETYIQNNKQNMKNQNADVTEEEIEDLADAFLHALSTTEYEIVEANAESADNIIVTLSIEGIDDTSIYQETEQEIIELHEDGVIADDELVSKNL